jgi:hypothetical protein
VLNDAGEKLNEGCCACVVQVQCETMEMDEAELIGVLKLSNPGVNTTL